MIFPEEKASSNFFVKIRDIFVDVLKTTLTVDVAAFCEPRISIASPRRVTRLFSVLRPAGKADIVKARRLDAARLKIGDAAESVNENE